MSSIHAAASRMQGAGQSLPQEACHNRSLHQMAKLDSLERRYVNDWTARMDLEAKAHDKMGYHVTTQSRQRSMTQERHRARNEAWAARAEMAARWRNHKGRERIERCQSAIDFKDRKMNDFLSWQNRVLFEAPRQELERRNTWIANMTSSSNHEVEAYHRMRLG
mmetsp:Transcript_25164/g.57097  ORF Transcript_25164/g.57097 Transcript_25164/m.57097 type:complete len:164 (-) Transcript_25164:66-557(-)